MKRGQPVYVEPQEYQDWRDSQLREWGKLTEKLHAEAGQAKTKAEVEAYYERIEDLRARQEKARKQLQELEGASEETWEKLRASIDEVFTDLEKAIGQVASEVT